MDTRFLVAVALIGLASTRSLAEDQVPATTRPKPGKYVPELHGSTGFYVPDLSGKYRHDPRPYDGGYGDRGEPYSNNLRGIFRQVGEQLDAQTQAAYDNLLLGPRDHLRFMIDFNYNGTGWQIIEFHWVRDGDETHPDSKQYSYVNENKLWDADQLEQSYEYERPAEDCEANCQPETPTYDPVQEQPDPVQESVPEQAQPEQEQQPTTNINPEKDSAKIHDTINEVLEYIQQQILPTLSKNTN
ncbi:hypothetical protein KR009_002185 [Drosophila setifemur]|nr:hypothetical protein KR009_002185 [Drosophila setifemur]